MTREKLDGGWCQGITEGGVILIDNRELVDIDEMWGKFYVY